MAPSGASAPNDREPFRSILGEVPGLCAGGFGAVADSEGFHPRRLPEWVLQRIGDPQVQFLSGMPAGLRLEMMTDASWVELTVQVTMLDVSAADLPPGAAFDVVVDGVAVAGAVCVDGNVFKVRADTGEADFAIGGPATVRLEGWSPGQCKLEIWLPHNAVVDILDFRVPRQAHVSPCLASRPTWAHYGSSISHCVNMSRPTLTWPAQVALRSDVSLRNLGFAGQCHLDGAIARLLRDAPIDALSLEVGINVLCDDTMRERTFVPAVHNFLDVVRDGHPETPIVVLSPIFCSALEDAPGPVRVNGAGMVEAIARPTKLMAGALTGRRVRQLLAEIVNERASSDDQLAFVNGLELLGPEQAASLTDGLHPDQTATTQIGEHFYVKVFGPDGLFSYVSKNEQL